MPGESNAGITSGLLLMLKKVQAGDWESASQVLGLLERQDLPNHRELGRVAAVRANLPSLRAALHFREKGPAAEAILVVIEAWEKSTPVPKTYATASTLLKLRKRDESSVKGD